jgi:hypothetical protein
MHEMYVALFDALCKLCFDEEWHKITEDAILHSHHRENLKSYICFDKFALEGCGTERSLLVRPG